ncbi:hypothetical protein SAMN04487829_1058 [Pseudobutyrivibrio sp. NOR37]|uniref:Uncharacterized protein n=1 Tax=Pseudobutyrivibrio xylanivorans TaxID=185007 RepID=A0A6M0LFX1_PSEXY|nr:MULTISPECIES: hypothetical protein [Pseudobutyrivibrio]NEX01465.1 hypothetical protein [Pseudobutyrivibrio xylanivorans]SFR67704.1 hypothetical protein SAMN04487829_1058 [Pseudobutyrivibrio sp. NOR37]
MRELTNNELQIIDGGVNGLKVAGGVLLVAAGVGECATVAFSAGGVCTALGGVGCIIDGLND